MNLNVKVWLVLIFSGSGLAAGRYLHLVPRKQHGTAYGGATPA
jgi:hypothetical protein